MGGGCSTLPQLLHSKRRRRRGRLHSCWALQCACPRWQAFGGALTSVGCLAAGAYDPGAAGDGDRAHPTRPASLSCSSSTLLLPHSLINQPHSLINQPHSLALLRMFQHRRRDQMPGRCRWLAEHKEPLLHSCSTAPAAAPHICSTQLLHSLLHSPGRCAGGAHPAAGL